MLDVQLLFLSRTSDDLVLINLHVNKPRPPDVLPVRTLSDQLFFSILKPI